MSDTKQVTGVVEVAGQKKGSDYCYIKVNGQFYGSFKTNYGHLKGQSVAFAAREKNGYWDVVGDVQATAAPAAAPAAPGRPAGGQSLDSRQSSIVMQSSYKTAAEVLGSMITADAVTLGTKKAAKYQIVLDYLDEIAYHIYQNTVDTTDFIASREGTAADGSDDSGDGGADNFFTEEAA